MDGIINVLKPPGMTSHDVVSFVRKTLNIKKVGHTGTLDPNAAGVLPICVGKATRVVQYFDEFTKTYIAELTLGFETDTQDKYGNVIGTADVPDITTDELKNVFNSFQGSIKQIPPMYSAIKYNGKKLYELAREGITVERQQREVFIHNILLLKRYDNKRVLFQVECSKGTYIRTLCSDIGRKLGTMGCMTFLLRTQVGDFNIDNAYTIEEIQEYVGSNRLDSIIIPLDKALEHYDYVNLNKNYFTILKNGGKAVINSYINESKFYDLEKKIRVYCDNDFIGIGIIKKNGQDIILKMDKVFI